MPHQKAADSVGARRYQIGMYEICFTVLDIGEDQGSLRDISDRLHRCMSARGCRIVRTDRSLSGQIFAVAEVDDMASAMAAADHVAVCIGQRCPVIVEITDSRAQQLPVLRRTIMPPQLNITAR